MRARTHAHACAHVSTAASSSVAASATLGTLCALSLRQLACTAGPAPASTSSIAASVARERTFGRPTRPFSISAPSSDADASRSASATSSAARANATSASKARSCAKGLESAIILGSSEPCATRAEPTSASAAATISSYAERRSCHRLLPSRFSSGMLAIEAESSAGGVYPGGYSSAWPRARAHRGQGRPA